MNPTTLNKNDEAILVKQLLVLLQSPENWKESSYTLDLVIPQPSIPDDPLQALRQSLSVFQNRVEFWTSTGFMFFALYRPAEIKFRIIQ